MIAQPDGSGAEEESVRRPDGGAGDEEARRDGADGDAAILETEGPAKTAEAELAGAAGLDTDAAGPSPAVLEPRPSTGSGADPVLFANPLASLAGGRRAAPGVLARLFAPGRRLPRLTLAAAGGVVSSLLTTLVSPEAGHLRPTAAAGFAAGACFGPAGLGVFAVVEAVVLFALGAPAWAALLAAAADGLLGAIGYLAFRDVGQVGRGLPNLGSYLTLLAAALVGALATGFALAWIGYADRLLYGTGLYAAGNLAAVVLAGLPLVVAAERGLGRHLVPIAGEVAAPPPERMGEDTVDEDTAHDAEATVFVARRRPARREVPLAVAGLVAVTLLVAPVAAAVPAIAPWVAVLYLLPVVAAAQTYGLRGGALAASVSGLAFLVALRLAELTIGWTVADPFHPLPLYAQLLVLSPLGAYLGQARERESRLRRELTLHHRLLRQDLLRVVQALTAAVEAKDSYTEAHLKRVADYAVAVGRRLGLGGRQLETLYYGAMLHDIGKIGVPESVLRKSGPLDAGESALMREHPAIGARIVAGLDLLRDAAPIILHHQERWDGATTGDSPGYPDGLAGEDMPLGSRIIAVVDAFDAMTTDRPYRPGRSAAEAAHELGREAGRQFDPKVVTAFLAVLAERPWV
ncbi:MAG TPA: HD domain-containing phosphohydrolase [Thermoanaerobaculia bacterium]|nr:HD domain-containing phosphohydrolase [Thermoanaerobaculia bacterium]